MRSAILEKIKSGLIANVGADSGFEEFKVESVETRIPSNVGVNIFIGLEIPIADPLSIEIGGLVPSLYEYECHIALLMKNGNYTEGQDNLDRVTNRIKKYLSDDIFEGLSEEQDGTIERVQGYSVESVKYTSGELKVGELGHIAIFTLKVKTDLNFN
jgi:hypothetical protein